jgi:hypothetical protein
MARHAHLSSTAFEFINAGSFVKIIRPFGSLALPKLSRVATITSPGRTAGTSLHFRLHIRAQGTLVLCYMALEISLDGASHAFRAACLFT